MLHGPTAADAETTEKFTAALFMLVGGTGRRSRPENYHVIEVSMDHRPTSPAPRGPYRTPAEPTHDDPSDPAPIDADPIPMTVLLGVLITSAARVVPSLQGREDFGREPAPALILVILSASLAIDALVSWARAADSRADAHAIATRRRLRDLMNVGVKRGSSPGRASSPTLRGR